MLFRFMPRLKQQLVWFCSFSGQIHLMPDFQCMLTVCWLLLCREAYRSHGFFYCSRIHVKSTVLRIFMYSSFIFLGNQPAKHLFTLQKQNFIPIKRKLSISPPPTPGLTSFCFLSCVIVFLCLAYFTWIMFSKIHPCCNVHGNLLPFSGLSIFCCVFKAHFVYPFISGHLHCFHLLVIVNYAAKNGGYCEYKKSLWDRFPVLLGIVSSRDNSVFSFFLIALAPTLLLINTGRDSSLPRPCQYFFDDFVNSSILMDLRWHHLLFFRKPFREIISNILKEKPNTIMTPSSTLTSCAIHE